MILFTMSDGQMLQGKVERPFNKHGPRKPTLKGFKAVFREGTFAVSVQADGPELAFISEHFSGIRMSRAPVVTWRGEDACFIADNLP